MAWGVLALRRGPPRHEVGVLSDEVRRHAVHGTGAHAGICAIGHAENSLRYTEPYDANGERQPGW